jgi:hypothetical protein
MSEELKLSGPNLSGDIQMTEVFVVMSNDFPDAVFGDAVVADDYCTKRMEEQRAKLTNKWETPRIYYRVYTFNLNEEGAPPR